jgi:hypothetical protein
VARKALSELKGSDLHKAKAAWRGVEPDERKGVITQLCEWLVERKHSLTLAAVDREGWPTLAPVDLADPWLACALHTALQVQRAHQGLERPKGLTFIVVDEHKAKVDGAAELLYDPPRWSDSYYDRKRRDPALACVLDSAFYAKSHHVGLVQVADSSPTSFGGTPSSTTSATARATTVRQRKLTVGSNASHRACCPERIVGPRIRKRMRPPSTSLQRQHRSRR